MNVHIIKPYSLEKNLGKVYNEAMNRIPDGDWACLMDYDTCFLTDDCGRILHEYATKYPEAGLFTSFTNRIHPKATDQLLDGQFSENLNMGYHIDRAYNQKRLLYKVTELNHEVSGFLMMVSKETWKKTKFVENAKCLSVDNQFSWTILESGKQIYRMDGLYVWHSYRIKNGVKDKSHLI
jgi:GT2 family glycosyltransferase